LILLQPIEKEGGFDLFVRSAAQSGVVFLSHHHFLGCFELDFQSLTPDNDSRVAHLFSPSSGNWLFGMPGSRCIPINVRGSQPLHQGGIGLPV
jgi:hypothetical protein